jgi:phosphatidylserine/phosphatidylglycerophosphate/cardiolipin synthase-like enzyme
MVTEVPIWTQGESRSFLPGLTFFRFLGEIPMRRRSDDLRSKLSNEERFRATGASLIHGNHLRILRDAQENYPAWEAAIQGARKTIHIEMYIIHNDKSGRHFRDLLAAKAREGVKVRVIYDWFGSLSLLGGGCGSPSERQGARFELPIRQE